MTSINVIKATPELLEKFYGDVPKFSQKAVAAVRGDEVLGVAGIYRQYGVNVLFSEIRPDIEEDIMKFTYRRAFVECMREVINYAKTSNLPVVSVAKEGRDISCRLLRRLGMKEIKPGVFKWNQ